MANKNPGRQYWAKRFETLQEAQLKESDQYYEDLEQIYKQASTSIQKDIDSWYNRLAKNNNLTLAQANMLLTPAELKEFKWSVEDYIKYGEENAINQDWMQQLENASARVHISRLEALETQLRQIVEVLYGNQVDKLDSLLNGIYEQGYYHTAYEVQKGFNVGFNFAKIDTDQLNMIIHKPWTDDGTEFSKRIWGQYRPDLVNTIHSELSQMLIKGQGPDKAIKNIAHKFDTSKSKSGNLVMTESAYFSSASRNDAYRQLGIQEYEIVATLDTHTSQICRSLDGEHLPLSQYEPWVTAPPFHNRCRTTTCPYFDDEFELGTTRAARDSKGKTTYVPSDMTYDDWENKFVN
ncbi:MAG: hypothetical protein K0R54_2077 [Clostridiaceae bacterium]|jgi:SPP1 gp7 family putative phage head morphogenesis protein|nr:hypothetical protein [Clostridiaceae bacterium]